LKGGAVSNEGFANISDGDVSAAKYVVSFENSKPGGSQGSVLIQEMQGHAWVMEREL
jgi:hypothetical protein